MRDPYEVLEIRKGSSKDEVRAAYKKLAKQYHPDQYDNNPLRDLAEDKMAEINEAYDYLMKHLSDNQNSSYNQNSGYNQQSSSYNQQKSGYGQQNSNYNQNAGYKQGNYTGNSNGYNNNYQNNRNQGFNGSYSGVNYQAIRTDINSNNLNAAQQKLNNMPTRDAEWNYLMGLIFLRKGWYDNAKTYITTAYNMNPNNLEYRNTFNQLTMQNNNYRNNYYNRNSRDADMCDCCTQLWCADTICECMGGDLISCC